MVEQTTIGSRPTQFGMVRGSVHDRVVSWFLLRPLRRTFHILVCWHCAKTPRYRHPSPWSHVDVKARVRVSRALVRSFRVSSHRRFLASCHCLLLLGLRWALRPDCHRLGSKCGDTRRIVLPNYALVHSHRLLVVGGRIPPDRTNPAWVGFSNDMPKTRRTPLSESSIGISALSLAVLSPQVEMEFCSAPSSVALSYQSSAIS